MKKYHSTILVVEDEPADQELIKFAFKSFAPTGIVHVANDGLEAIAYMMGDGKFSDRVEYPYPTFIITDLRMPRADGFAVLQHLQANPAYAIIPSVVLTSSDDLDDIKTAYVLGASSYHVKPIGFAELRSQLKILHDYWMTCEVPEVDDSGHQIATVSEGKLGKRIPKPDGSSTQNKV